MIDPKITALRLDVFANGFTPLPSRGKTCMIPEWQLEEVDAALITGRWARTLKASTTCLRLDNGLAVIDIDVDDAAAVAEISERLKALLPGAFLLCRHGRGAKLALFVRTAEPFKRLQSRSWTRPSEPAKHQVEIFGGGSSRYFGAHGWHTVGEIMYRWAANSPVDTPLRRLPVFTVPQFAAAADAADNTLERLGWTPVSMPAARTAARHKTAVRYPKPTLADLAAAMAVIPIHPETYDRWLRIGMALHHATDGGQAGLELWDEWSRRGDKYDDGAAAKWAGFSDGEITAGTIFHEADKAKQGWRRGELVAIDMNDVAEKLRRMKAMHK